MKRYLVLVGFLAASLGPVSASVRAQDGSGPGGSSPGRDPLVPPYTFGDALNALKMSIRAIPEKLSHDVTGEEPNSAPDGKVTARDAQVIAQRAAGGITQPPVPAPAPSLMSPRQPQSSAVPDLAGLRRDEAESRLRIAGFLRVSILSVGESPPSRDREFTVQSQDPPAGARANPQDTIALFIYGKMIDRSGEPRPGDEVEVPQVVGQRAGDAKTLIVGKGLRSIFEAAAVSAPTEDSAFTIQSQTPEAGAKVPRGTVVALRVYAALQPNPIPPTPSSEISVPSVVGLGAKDAKTRLVQAGLSQIAFVAVAEPPPSPDHQWTVQKQDPPAGSSAQRGDTVTLSLYGKTIDPSGEPRPDDDVEVPQVVGLRAGDAKTRLAGKELQVSLEAAAGKTPTAARAFTIQSQTPKAGAKVPRGTVIAVRVYAPFQPNPLAPSPTPSPNARPVAAAPSVDPVAHGGKDMGWVITFDGKSSDWFFEYESPGRYKAAEHGLAGAKGTATYDSATGALSITAATHDNYYAATYHFVRKGVDAHGNAVFDEGLIKFTIYHAKPPEKPLEYKATLKHKGSNTGH